VPARVFLAGFLVKMGVGERGKRGFRVRAAWTPNNRAIVDMDIGRHSDYKVQTSSRSSGRSGLVCGQFFLHHFFVYLCLSRLYKMSRELALVASTGERLLP
jgi:hypothetical protein